MKKLTTLLVLFALVLSAAAIAAKPTNPAGTCVLVNGDVVDRGFDEFGYNRCAHQFVGTYLTWGMEKLGWPENTTACDPYCDDKLVMKWNEEWDRGNYEGWTDPNGYNAWNMNEWNGAFPGGSGEVYHFKTRWDADCAAGTYTGASYCIWNQFEVLSEHYTDGDGHVWLAKANPVGYGSN